VQSTGDEGEIHMTASKSVESESQPVYK